MLDVDSIATNLFDKIRARFDKISVGDQEAKATQEPSKCRFFNFDYVDDIGNNFGNVTITLIDERSLKLYFGKNLTADLDEAQKSSWYDFLRDLRMFAKRNLLSFDARDITRSNLNIKDLRQLSVSSRPDTIHNTDVTESKQYGNTKKVKYETIDPGTRLRIIYSESVEEAMGGSRTHKVHGIYIEDSEGQRFKVPTPSMREARALGRHVAMGGNPNDDLGKHIAGLSGEMRDVGKFCRAAKHKTFEDHEAVEMVSIAKQRYHDVRHILNKLQNKRGYQFYKDEFKPINTLQDDIDVEGLRKKFITTNFDDRLEPGLAHVARAQQDMKSRLDRDLDHFAESLDQLEEGTWQIPDNDIAIKHLQAIMAKPLAAGIDGSNATGALYDIVGDDELFDRIYDASKGSPEMDVRPIIEMWLKSNMPDVYEKVKTTDPEGGEESDPTPEEPAPAPEPAEPPAEEPPADPNAAPPAEGDADAEAEAVLAGGQPPQPQQPPQPGNESGDPLAVMRRLAGIR
jgi:hypothetical protein